MYTPHVGRVSAALVLLTCLATPANVSHATAGVRDMACYDVNTDEIVAYFRANVTESNGKRRVSQLYYQGDDLDHSSTLPDPTLRPYDATITAWVQGTPIKIAYFDTGIVASNTWAKSVDTSINFVYASWDPNGDFIHCRSLTYVYARDNGRNWWVKVGGEFVYYPWPL